MTIFNIDDFVYVEGNDWLFKGDSLHVLAEGMTIEQHVQELNSPNLAQPNEIITILPAVTLWERMTENEADQVNEAIATQPVRTQRIFTTANTFRSDHELWPLLVQVATGLFGADRADELLAE